MKHVVEREHSAQGWSRRRLCHGQFSALRLDESTRATWAMCSRCPHPRPVSCPSCSRSPPLRGNSSVHSSRLCLTLRGAEALDAGELSSGAWSRSRSLHSSNRSFGYMPVRTSSSPTNMTPGSAYANPLFLAEGDCAPDPFWLCLSTTALSTMRISRIEFFCRANFQLGRSPHHADTRLHNAYGTLKQSHEPGRYRKCHSTVSRTPLICLYAFSPSPASSEHYHRYARHYHYHRSNNDCRSSIEPCSNVCTGDYNHVLVPNIVDLIRFHRSTHNHQHSLVHYPCGDYPLVCFLCC